MTPKKLLATYSRVSTSTQEEQKTIKTQLLVFKEFSDTHDVPVIQEYIDDGWSGDTLARPALDQLREDAKKGIWNTLLVYDPDRLARRYSYQELIMDELKEAGIEVIFITVSTPKNSEDKILHGVRGLFAEYERAKISERFRLGKLRKVKEGHILVSDPLYGYNYIPKQDNRHGYYEVNSDEARVVKMIFDMVDKEGLTLRKIVRRLQELGIKPKKSKRGVWNTSTLSHLLRNGGYIGEAKWGSTYAVVPENPLSTEKYRKVKKSSRRVKPKDEWFIVAIPAIIEKDVFVRVQERLRTNFLLSQRNKKNEYLLANLMRCTCGRTRSGEGILKGKHLYYRCSDRVLSYPLPAKCKEKGMNARVADKMVWNAIVDLMTSPEMLQKQITRWLDEQSGKTVVSASDVELMQKEIAKLKNEEDRYNKAYGSGFFTIEQLKEYTVPIREKITSLEIQKAKAIEHENAIGVSLLPTQKEVEEFAKESTEIMKDLNFSQKREIVVNTIDKVVGTKEKLQVYGHIPVKNINVFTSYRYCRSPKCG